MNYFESQAKDTFGISCGEAIKKGWIAKGTTLRGSKIVSDGWECRANGNNYPTQFEALEAHFKCVEQAKRERQEENDRLLGLFNQFKGDIESAGFLAEKAFLARNRVFDWEDYVLNLRDEGKIKEDIAQNMIDSYTGMIINLKNNERITV